MYAAEITRSDIERLVLRDFGHDMYDAILERLDQYDLDFPWLSRSRVQAAILKLSLGDAVNLERHLAVAKTEPRDVVAGAEYPRMLRLGPFGARAMSQDDPSEFEQLQQDDWNEYRSWLSMESLT